MENNMEKYLEENLDGRNIESIRKEIEKIENGQMDSDKEILN